MSDVSVDKGNGLDYGTVPLEFQWPHASLQASHLWLYLLLVQGLRNTVLEDVCVCVCVFVWFRGEGCLLACVLLREVNLNYIDLNGCIVQLSCLFVFVYTCVCYWSVCVTCRCLIPVSDL